MEGDKGLKKIFLPFKVWKFYSKNIIIWFLMTVVLGNVVILLSDYNNLLSSGYFYTYAISLLVSHMALVFSDIVIKKINGEEENVFIGIKIITTIVAIILIIVMIILLSKILIQSNSVKIIQGNSNCIDISQMIFFGISVIVSLYIYCLDLISNPEVYDLFIELEDKKVGDLIKSSEELSDDGEGVEV